MTQPDNHQPVPMDRGAKAEALLLHFTAEAHRRKWSYDRGLDDDGVPVRSEAFDALHGLGEEMRVGLEKLRAAPAPVSVPPVDRAALRDRIAQVLAARFTADGDVSRGMRVIDPDDEDDPEPARRVRPLEAADAVLTALPAPADRAAVLREAADDLATAFGDPMAKHIGALGASHLRRRAREVEAGQAGEDHPETPLEKRLRYSERRNDELRAECKRRGKRVLEQSETIRALEREVDEVRRQLGAEILRVGQAEAGLRRMADEAQPDDTLHTCPGRWGGPHCTCFDTDQAQPGTEASADVDPVYDPRAWETYRRDAGCGCTAPAPVDCKIPHGTGTWLCVCHRLAGPPVKDTDPPGTFLSSDDEALRKHFTHPNRCTSANGIFRCSRPVGHAGDHRTGRTFWGRRAEDDAVEAQQDGVQS
ncbi:hypothetical protein [Streptomyces sp. NPDC002132]|uniref:hypothetical protein n=1 Tax=unclassified Streptomyces TaxID=2593676 RepID=UPI00331829B7